VGVAMPTRTDLGLNSELLLERKATNSQNLSRLELMQKGSIYVVLISQSLYQYSSYENSWNGAVACSTKRMLNTTKCKTEMLKYGKKNENKKKKIPCHLRLNRQNRVRLYFGLLFLLLDPSFFFFPNI
jgi:hypothetical protein